MERTEESGFSLNDRQHRRRPMRRRELAAGGTRGDQLELAHARVESYARDNSGRARDATQSLAALHEFKLNRPAATRADFHVVSSVSMFLSRKKFGASAFARRAGWSSIPLEISTRLGPRR